jgi:hypothetical protein
MKLQVSIRNGDILPAAMMHVSGGNVGKCGEEWE